MATTTIPGNGIGIGIGMDMKCWCNSTMVEPSRALLLCGWEVRGRTDRRRRRRGGKWREAVAGSSGGKVDAAGGREHDHVHLCPCHDVGCRRLSTSCPCTE
jgi:hypothetical protein